MNVFSSYRHVLAAIVLAAGASSASAQRLYSTTDVVFHYDAADNTYTPLGDPGTANMAGPIGALLHIGNGELIGVTNNSPSLYGAIYHTDTTTNAVTMLHQFSNVTKSVTGFVQGDDGLLYTLGVTGTASSTCALYSFNLTTNAYTQVHAIPGFSNALPLARLMRASNGLIYGVTEYGGTNDAGSLFSYNTATATFTTLFSFGGANGTEPLAGLLQATNGKLYGVSSYGGANDKGVLYSFDPSGNAYTKLYDFVQADGENPNAPLMQATNGVLYSTTMTGGASFLGVLYSYTIATNTYTRLHSFTFTVGYGPRSQPIEGSSGVLYGGTNQGGVNMEGCIYSWDIGTGTFTKLFDGTSVTGSFARPFLSFETVQIGMAEAAAPLRTVMVHPNPAADAIRLEEPCLGCTYEILDQLGRSVAAGVVMDRTMDVDALGAGVYTVYITGSQQPAMQARFVKE